MNLKDKPFEDIRLQIEHAKLVDERGKVIKSRSESVEKRKFALQNHVNMLDKHSIDVPQIMVENYNNLVISLSVQVAKRLLLKQSWDNLVKQRNTINELAEVMLKGYDSRMQEQIEQMLKQFGQVLNKQEQILQEREEILIEEERLLTESEKELYSLN